MNYVTFFHILLLSDLTVTKHTVPSKWSHDKKKGRAQNCVTFFPSVLHSTSKIYTNSIKLFKNFTPPSKNLHHLGWRDGRFFHVWVHDISRYCPRYSKVLSIMDIFIHFPIIFFKVWSTIFQGIVRNIPRYCPQYSKVLSIFYSFDIL